MRLSIAFVAAVALGLVPKAWAGANAGAHLEAHAAVYHLGTNCSTLTHVTCRDLTPSIVAPAGGNNIVAAYVGHDLCGCVIPPPLDILGVDFGIRYSGGYGVISWQSCAQMQLPAANWPASGSGNSIVWTTSQSGNLVLLGWFRVATYSGYGPMMFVLTAHPQWGVARTVDSNSNFDVLYGEAVASHDGSSGYNECCVTISVAPSTWGRIKSHYDE